MKLVDANVLIYAENASAREHVEARGWLVGALHGNETLVVPWVSALAYLRISTLAQVFPAPLSIERAVAFLRALYANDGVVSGQPDRHHLDRVEALLATTGVGGNLVNDAHLAALALQYDAVVISFDNDFARFPGVRWERPTISEKEKP